MATMEEMDCQRTTMPDSTKTTESDDGSDEDLEALRLAALQSRKSSKNNTSVSFGNNGRNSYQTYTNHQWNGTQNRNWNNKIYKWRQRSSNLIVINPIPSENTESEVADVLVPIALPQNRYARITPECKPVRNTDNNGPKKFSRLESHSSDSDNEDSSSESEKSSTEDDDEKLSQNNVKGNEVEEEANGCDILLTEDSSCDFPLSEPEENLSASGTVDLKSETPKTSTHKEHGTERARSPVNSNSSKENASVRFSDPTEESSGRKFTNKVNGNSFAKSRENVESDRGRTFTSPEGKETPMTDSKVRHRRIITISAKEDASKKRLGDDPLNCDPKTDLRLILKNKRGLVAEENSDEKERKKRRKRSPTPDSPVVVRSVLSVVKVKNMQREDEKEMDLKWKPAEKDGKRRKRESSRDSSPKTKFSVDDPVKRPPKESKAPVHTRLGTPCKSHKNKRSSNRRSADPSRSRSPPKAGKDRKRSNEAPSRKDDRNSGNFTPAQR